MDGKKFAKFIYMDSSELKKLNFDLFTAYLRENSFKYLIVEWYYYKMLDDIDNNRTNKFESNRYLAWSLWNGIINYKILDQYLNIHDLYVNGDKETQKNIWNIIYNSYYNMYSQLDQEIITEYYKTTLNEFCIKLTSITISLIRSFDIGNDNSIGSYDYEDIIPEIIDFSMIYYNID